MERSIEKMSRWTKGDRGRQISKEEGSRTTQQARKIHHWMLWSTMREEMKDRLAKPRKAGQVDLGFRCLGF
jgi:hypothetical protein